MALYNTTTKEEFEKHTNSGRAVLVDFWAEWCPPCRAMAPVLEGVSKKIPEADIVKVNVEESDENQALAAQYEVRSIPNMLVFKDGEVVENYVGIIPSAVLMDDLKKHS